MADQVRTEKAPAPKEVPLSNNQKADRLLTLICNVQDRNALLDNPNFSDKDAQKDLAHKNDTDISAILGLIAEGVPVPALRNGDWATVLNDYETKRILLESRNLVKPLKESRRD